MRLKQPTETDLVYATLQALQALGIFAWRNNSGMAMGAGGTRVRFGGMPGASDILGVLPGGRMLAIECKMPGKKLTDKQRAFLARVNAEGGAGFVVFDVSEVPWKIEHARSGGKFRTDMSPASGSKR